MYVYNSFPYSNQAWLENTNYMTGSRIVQPLLSSALEQTCLESKEARSTSFCSWGACFLHDKLYFVITRNLTCEKLPSLVQIHILLDTSVCKQEKTKKNHHLKRKLGFTDVSSGCCGFVTIGERSSVSLAYGEAITPWIKVLQMAEYITPQVLYGSFCPSAWTEEMKEWDGCTQPSPSSL